MGAALELESTLTDRYQTTVPDAVRRVLNLGKRDKIRYIVEPDGKVTICRVADVESDPALNVFLHFLAHDISTNPQHLQSVDEALVERIQLLVQDVEADLDAPLLADDE
jgi:antitoxin PrlF